MSEPSPSDDAVAADPGASFEPADPPVIIAGLSQLLAWSKAIVLVPWREHAPVGADGCNWIVEGYEESVLFPIANVLRERLRAEGPLGYLEMAPGTSGKDKEAWTVWAEPVR